MKVVRVVVLVLVALVVIALASGYGMLRASLPKLDGALEAPSLTASVSISRDERGVPTIAAANRPDLAYGLGFAHAQDRFFQMDLSRRLAAGELAELFGSAALDQDKKARLFRFRHLAQGALAEAAPEQRAVVEAYTRGVNAGLASLSSRPWEYWLLRSKPVPWRAEDVALVSYAMWWDLQYNELNRERVKRALNLRLHGADCAAGWKCAMTFFYPRGTSWDAPNAAGPVAPAAPIRIPTAEELDVRGAAATTGTSPPSPPSPPRPPTAGSNGWAVAGDHSSSGAALIASDMHLTLRVPTVWYRARMRMGDLDLNGLTLPGAPVLVAGSNGHIAWGFTNSYGDWSDLTLNTCTGQRAPSAVREIIHVKGEADVTFDVRSEKNGLIYSDESPQGRNSCSMVRWLAAVPGSTNFNIIALERATTAEQAIALAPTIGIPHQNFMVGDSQGNIGWSILGRIPDALGEARLDGSAPWDTAQTHPKLLNPPAGRIWTANARAIDDPTYEAIIGGDEAPLGVDYDLGARAHQIRDDLMAITTRATPADMLRVQTDDRAQFLTRWHDLLVTLLDEPALQGHADRAEFKRLIRNWRAQASTDSVGYRLVRKFHTQFEHATWDMFLQALHLDEASDAPPPSQFEGALWELANQQPLHLLAAKYPSWREFLLAQVDETVTALRADCPDLAKCTWGERRAVSVRHPLSRALPFSSKLLDMPTMQLPGDHDMPRVQDGAFGASERFAVSPGHEAEGYLMIAGGQSGHPLSPYYRAGFAEWAAAKPIAFLPGRAEHELTLTPAK